MLLCRRFQSVLRPPLSSRAQRGTSLLSLGFGFAFVAATFRWAHWPRPPSCHPEPSRVVREWWRGICFCLLARALAFPQENDLMQRWAATSFSTKFRQARESQSFRKESYGLGRLFAMPTNGFARSKNYRWKNAVGPWTCSRSFNL